MTQFITNIYAIQLKARWNFLFKLTRTQPLFTLSFSCVFVYLCWVCRFHVNMKLKIAADKQIWAKEIIEAHEVIKSFDLINAFFFRSQTVLCRHYISLVVCICNLLYCLEFNRIDNDRIMRKPIYLVLSLIKVTNVRIFQRFVIIYHVWGVQSTLYNGNVRLICGSEKL